MAELDFTGERVVPGQVDVDLWNEHLSRYCLALHVAPAKRVVDLGSGSGYGAWLLATVAKSVVGVDVDQSAVEYAQSRFISAGLRFQTASATATDLPSASAELITAFELIEHLPDPDALLTEAKRLLSPEGVLIVSTPNREFYAKTRGPAGANPYHVHEFSEAEYGEALRARFRQVRILRQNHTAGVVIEDDGDVARLTSLSARSFRDSHFFVAICSDGPLPSPQSIVVTSAGGNLLADRLAHIDKLSTELATKDVWLQQAVRDKQALMEEQQKQIAAYRQLEAELQKSNEWAAAQDAQLAQARIAIAKLELEMSQQAAGYEEKVSSLEGEIARVNAWGAALDGELAVKRQEQVDTLAALHHTEAELEDRTKWAQTLDAERERLTAMVTMASGSRWVRLGRRLGVGPVFDVERPQ